MDVGHRLDHPLAQVARLVAIAQLNSFVFARGSTAGHGRAAHDAARQPHLRLNRGIAARIENLPALNALDLHAISQQEMTIINKRCRQRRELDY